MAEVSVTGLAELQEFLDQVPAKLEANVMMGALRSGAEEIKPVAQANVHSVSGLLAGGLKIGTKIEGNTVTASLYVTGKHAFLAKWIEFGTAAHNISAKSGALFFGGMFAKSVNHPGARARPFLRPAMDEQAGAAVVAAADYMKGKLTKEGLE